MITKIKSRSKWRLKGCSRCGGDLNYNIYNNEWECFQCGNVIYDKVLDNEILLDRKPNKTIFRSVNGAHKLFKGRNN